MKIREGYAVANERSVTASVDVTPSWWPTKKRDCYGRAAEACASASLIVSFTLGVHAVKLEMLVTKDGDWVHEAEAVGTALEALEAELAEPPNFAHMHKFLDHRGAAPVHD